MIVRTYLKKDFHHTILYHKQKIKDVVAFTVHCRNLSKSPNGRMTYSIEKSFRDFVMEQGMSVEDLKGGKENVMAHIIVVVEGPRAVTIAEYRDIIDSTLKKMGFTDEPFWAVMHLDTCQIHLHIMAPLKKGVKYDLRYRTSHSRIYSKQDEKPEEGPARDISLHPSQMYRVESTPAPLSIQVRHLAGGVAKNYTFDSLSSFDAALRFYGLAIRPVNAHNKKIKHDYGMYYRLSTVFLPRVRSVSASSLRASLMRPHIEKRCQKFIPEGILQFLRKEDCEGFSTSVLSTMQALSEAGIDTVLKKGNGTLEDIILVDHIRFESVSLLSIHPAMREHLKDIWQKAEKEFAKKLRFKDTLFSYSEHFLFSRKGASLSGKEISCSLSKLENELKKSPVIRFLKQSGEALGEVMISIFNSVRMETRKHPEIPAIERMKNISQLILEKQRCDEALVSYPNISNREEFLFRQNALFLEQKNVFESFQNHSRTEKEKKMENSLRNDRKDETVPKTIAMHR